MHILTPWWKRGALVALALLALAGCTSMATLSLAVRTGDTVIVGLSGEAGQFPTNTGHEIIRSGDVTARVTDSGGNTRNVTVRNVFRVYADPTSNEFAADKGQWLAVIDFVDGSGNPVALSTGPATLNIQSPKLTRNLSISTTILAGTGSPHPLTGAENELNKLPWLAPAQQALVTVTGNIGSQRIGAVQYVFNVPQEPVQTPSGNSRSVIEGVKLVSPRSVSFQSWSTPNPAGGTDLNVVMTAPQGIAGNRLKDLDIALVAEQLRFESNPTAYFRNSLQSATFYDIDGDVLNGLTVTVGDVE